MMFNFMGWGYMVGGIWVVINMRRYNTREIQNITIKK